MPRYILYARKSTESEDRQVLSIDSQVRELQDYAQEKQLNVVSVQQESRTAKAPGRPVFAEVLQDISRGRADGIVCWKLDRLARNAVDGGSLIWSVDEGKLREIVTPGRTYTNTANDKFFMQLEFGIAKKYVDDLSDNVKRGLRAKLKMGWRPGVAPIGYVNDLATKTVVPDPERFELVRRMWDHILAGQSPVSVLYTANAEWGFRTRTFRRQGNKPLSRSGLYRLLSNPFYYGLVELGGDTYAGAHKPMISKDEFDRVQELLGRPNRKHTKRYLFAFTGLIRCGECRALVTAEEKVNRYGSRYIYYHCTKRRVPCSQKTIRVERLEEQICDALAKIQIDDEFRDWALAYARGVREREARERQGVNQSLAKSRIDAERKVASLLDLRLRGLISDDEYALKKRELNSEVLRFKHQEAQNGSGAPIWFEPFAKAISFATLAPNRFAGGSREEKRAILLALGSNLFLRDRILRIQAQKPLALLADASDFRTQLGRLDGIRTFFEKHPTLIQWPAFCVE